MWIDQTQQVADMWIGLIVNSESLNFGSLIGLWAKPMFHFVILSW